jgi:hypothetical protein
MIELLRIVSPAPSMSINSEADKAGPVAGLSITTVFLGSSITVLL